MRILWLSHLIPYPPKGGVLQRAHHLLREVAKYHDVDLLAFNQVDLMRPLFPDPDEGIEEARQALSKFCKHVDFFSIESDVKPYGKYYLAIKSLITPDPYTINWLKSSVFRKALEERLNMAEYDLIHFDTISLISYLKYIDSNAASVLDHHNIESHMLKRHAKNEASLLKKLYYFQEGARLERIEKKYCAKFTLNITCSEMDKERLNNIVSDCWVEEIPNSVDTDYFNPDTTVDQQKSLLFIGSLSWYPNAQAVRFIIDDLWPKLKSSVEGISIDIIGADPPDDIVQLSKDDSNFRVHGFVNDIRSYFDRAAVYVCPISDGGGTKLKVLDALSMKKAIVANPIACEGIQVQNGVDVVFAQTPDEYIDAIIELLDNEEKRRSIGEAARYLIEQNYAHDMVGEKLSSLFEASLSKSMRDT